MGAGCDFKCKIQTGGRWYRVTRTGAAPSRPAPTAAVTTTTATPASAMLVELGDAVTAAVPNSDTTVEGGPEIVRLGSSQHIQLLLQRIAELQRNTACEDLASSRELVARAHELHFLLANPDTFATADSAAAAPGTSVEYKAGAPSAAGFDSTHTLASHPLQHEPSITSSMGDTIHVTVSTFGDIKAGVEEIEVDDHSDVALFRVPQMRQYFTSDGVLHRTAHKAHVPWLELFEDLIYVAALAKISHILSAHIGWTGLYEFVLCFVPLFFHWSMLALYNNRMVHNDMVHKFWSLLQMIVVLGLGVNATNAFDPDTNVNTSLQFLTTVMTGQGLVQLATLYDAYFIPEHRAYLLTQAVIRIPEESMYILAALMPAHSTAQMIAWSLACASCAATSFFGGMTTRALGRYGYMTGALNIEHIVERYSNWVAVTLGEVATAIMFVNTRELVLPDVGSAFGLAIAFAIQLTYIRVEGGSHASHAIRRNAYTGVSWNLLHLPFTMSIAAMGANVSNMVNMILVGDSDLHSFQHYFFWGVLAFTYLSMAVLASLHEPLAHVPHLTLMSPRGLIGLRLLLVVIFVALGFVGKALHFTPLANLVVAASVALVGVVVEEIGRVPPPRAVVRRMLTQGSLQAVPTEEGTSALEKLD
ncbi:bacterial low temperature requirement A protein-domain-containing protein [Blastocladiella britannica]|nr:bacterial low temperature requirement A protein-domain-containing protein [Blastocladiella britannica]